MREPADVRGVGMFVLREWLRAAHVLWLVSAGPVTAVPLLLFSAAARRSPLAVLGAR